jgi:predicted  nucleic acid-binding Zn-ribbon protein
MVAREERTKDFWRKADAVVLMLYANRAFDATDRDILFKNVRNCGVGKVIIGVNKYDIPCAKGQYESEITDYVKEEITKACQECKDDIFIQILKQSDPILLSAEMALLSELSMEKIKSKEEYLFAWNRHCNDFGISTRKEMFEISHLDNLTNAVREIIAKEKDEILLAKPMNAIMAAGNKKKSDIETELSKLQMLISDLEKPDDELEEKLEHLSKANRRLNKKIDGLGDDLDMAFREIVRKGSNDMEDMVDKTCREIGTEIDNLGLFQNADKIIPSIDGKLQTLVTRTLKRHVEDLAYNAKSKIKNSVGDFISEAEDVLMKYLPEFDAREFVKRVEKEIDIEVNDKDVFSFDATTSEEEYGFWNGVFDFLNGYSLGTLKLLTNAFGHGKTVSRLHEIVNEIRSGFDPEPFLNTIYKQKDAVIEKVKSSFISELIEPLQHQVEEIKSDKSSKEKNLNEAQIRAESLKKEKEIVEKQIESMK